MAQVKVTAGLAVAFFSVVTISSAQAGVWGNSDAKSQTDGKPLVQKVYDPGAGSYKDTGSDDDDDRSSSRDGYGSSYKPKGGYGDDYDRGGRYGRGGGYGGGYGDEPSYIRPYAVVKKLNNHGYYKVEFIDKTPPSYQLYGCKNGINYKIRVNGWGNIVDADEVGYCHRYHRFKDWWRSHRPW